MGLQPTYYDENRLKGTGFSPFVRQAKTKGL